MAYDQLYTVSVLDFVEKQFDHDLLRSADELGLRVFTRYVYRHTTDPAWDDWKLAAVIRSRGLEWIMDWGQDVRDEVRRRVIHGGATHGKFTVGVKGGDLTVWFVTARFDGPGQRLSDTFVLPGRRPAPKDA